jgi:4-amino-4-deoxy-L-arabinose transferase-like glycosyltransferase
LQGAWIRVLGSGRGTVLILLLFFAVLSAWLIYELSRREAGRLPAAAAVAAWVVHPAVQASYEQTMMDLPVAALCLLSALAFRDYLARPRAAAALRFGTVAGAALLVKQQALVLASFPVASLLVARRLELTRRADLWMAALPPLLLAGPWYVLTLPVFYKNPARWAGLAGQGSASAPFPLLFWWQAGGWFLTSLSLIGLVRAVVRPDPGRSV